MPGYQVPHYVFDKESVLHSLIQIDSTLPYQTMANGGTPYSLRRPFFYRGSHGKLYSGGSVAENAWHTNNTTHNKTWLHAGNDKKKCSTSTMSWFNGASSDVSALNKKDGPR